MKVGQKIKIDQVVWKVVFISEGEIKLQSITGNAKPGGIRWGLHKEDTKEIKLMGWVKYYPYELVN